jgi:hypothetical protein
MALCFNRDCSPRHEIKLEELMVWEMELPEVARRVAKALSIPGPAAELIPTRLFRLGREPTQGLMVYLSRGELSTNQIPKADLLLTFMFRWFRGTQTPSTLTIKPLFEAFDPIHVDMWTPRPDALALAAASKTEWLTVGEAAKLFRKSASYLSSTSAKARISKAATAGKFVTNGETGAKRRIDTLTFHAWKSKAVDRGLDDEDKG